MITLLKALFQNIYEKNGNVAKSTWQMMNSNNLDFYFQ